MEPFIKEFDTGGENRTNVRFAVDHAKDTNGQTVTTSIGFSEKNGGNYALHAIEDTTERNSEQILHGIKGSLEGNRGWLQQVYLKPLGTKELRAIKKFRAGIVERNSIPRNTVRDSALNRVRCSAIKGLIYLIENKLITV